jgi:hypothetical protein
VPIDPGKVKAKAEEIIYNRLGTNLAPGEPKYLETKHTWSVPLEFDLPRVVEDKRTKQLKYVVFHLGNIGSIEIDSRVLKPVGIPRRSDLNSTVEDKLLQIRSKVENLLLHTASLQFAKLVSIKHMMTPLANLVTSVLRHDRFALPSTQSTWRSVVSYANLLEKKDFLVRDGTELRPSATLQSLYQKLGGDLDSTIEHVLKDIIENDYEVIYSDFRIKTLSPYVQISSTYYDYALSVHDLIELDEDDLWDAYSTVYGTASSKRHFRFDDYLRELGQESINLLRQTESGYWQGDEKVFETLEHNLASLGGVVS